MLLLVIVATMFDTAVGDEIAVTGMGTAAE
jgi:hypothetical protein